MNKYVYFVSNNKKPNAKFFITCRTIPAFDSRSKAREYKNKLLETGAKGYKVFRVTMEAVR